MVLHLLETGPRSWRGGDCVRACSFDVRFRRGSYLKHLVSISYLGALGKGIYHHSISSLVKEEMSSMRSGHSFSCELRKFPQFLYRYQLSKTWLNSTSNIHADSKQNRKDQVVLLLFLSRRELSGMGANGGGELLLRVRSHSYRQGYLSCNCFVYIRLKLYTRVTAIVFSKEYGWTRHNLIEVFTVYGNQIKILSINWRQNNKLNRENRDISAFLSTDMLLTSNCGFRVKSTVSQKFLKDHTSNNRF